MKQIHVFWVLLMLMNTGYVYGATVLEIKGDAADGALMTVTMEGEKVRVDFNTKKDYRLVDLEKKEQYLVLDENKTVLTLGMPKRKKKSKNIKKVQLVNKGEGPEVAGYATQVYELFADEVRCATLYNSKDALEVEDLVRFQSYSQRVRVEKVGSQGNPTFAQAIACSYAAQLPIDKLEEYGVPLKVTGMKGHVLSELTAIRGEITVDPGYFSLPSDYKHSDMDNLFAEAMKKALEEEKEKEEDGVIETEAEKKEKIKSAVEAIFGSSKNAP